MRYSPGHGRIDSTARPSESYQAQRPEAETLRGVKEGVQIIDLDKRSASGTGSDARTVYERFAGSPKGKAFVAGGGEVRIATSEGLFTF